MSVYRRIRDAFHEPDSTAYKRVESVIAVFIVVSIGLFAVELALGYRVPLIDWIDRVILVVFVMELVLRVATWSPPVLEVLEVGPAERVKIHIRGRLGYLLRPINLVDLLTVLALVPALRAFRALRLLRLARGTRLFRYSSPLRGTVRAFEDNALLYAGAFSVLGAQVVLGGVSLYIAERAHNDAVGNIGDGIWWALVTITTVGFGDIAPVTASGRVFASVLMVGGMFTLALFAGIIGHSLLNAVLGVREEQFRMSTIVDHLIICGYDRGARLLIDAVLAELDPQKTPVVIFAPKERADDVPPELHWVKGDPTKESELDKVRPTRARAVIIPGSRLGSPQEADALTILTAFTLRSYLKKHPDNGQRKRPLYVVAEVLDAENVSHCRAAGADEVIETTRLGFSLVAHAITMPGTARIMGEVATVGANSLYVGQLTAEHHALDYGTLASRIKRDTGALLIGVRDEATGADTINPPDNAAVGPGKLAIYLAGAPVLPAARREKA